MLFKPPERLERLPSGKSGVIDMGPYVLTLRRKKI